MACDICSIRLLFVFISCVLLAACRLPVLAVPILVNGVDVDPNLLPATPYVYIVASPNITARNSVIFALQTKYANYPELFSLAQVYTIFPFFSAHMTGSSILWMLAQPNLALDYVEVDQVVTLEKPVLPVPAPAPSMLSFQASLVGWQLTGQADLGLSAFSSVEGAPGPRKLKLRKNRRRLESLDRLRRTRTHK